MAKVSVPENSKNTRPAMPPMNRMGMKAADQRQADGDDRKIRSGLRRRRPPAAAHALLDVAMDVSIMTMASSTTKPTATTIAISEMLSRVKPATHIAAAVRRATAAL